MSRITDLAELLVKVSPETLDKIAEYEAQGRYNEHLDSLDGAVFTPVDGSYEYLPKTHQFKRFLQKRFIVKPFMKYANKLFKTQVVGRENMQGLRSAIVCCNHVNKLDCMAICQALKPKKVYTSAAQFNNMEGFLGDMMRVGGMLPMSDNYSAMKNFDKTVTTLLQKGNFVTFYPESSEWWCYEKPRPLFPGAYRFAAKNQVPVLPVFITFRQTKQSSADRTALKQFIVNIGKPIYPDSSLSVREAAERMRLQNGLAWKEIYETFYQKPLVR